MSTTVVMQQHNHQRKSERKIVTEIRGYRAFNMFITQEKNKRNAKCSEFQKKGRLPVELF